MANNALAIADGGFEKSAQNGRRAHSRSPLAANHRTAVVGDVILKNQTHGSILAGGELRGNGWICVSGPNTGAGEARNKQAAAPLKLGAFAHSRIAQKRAWSRHVRLIKRS